MNIARKSYEKIIAFLLIAITIMWAAPTRHTQAEAAAWIEERKEEKWAVDYDRSGRCPQCVDLIEYYFDYLVGYHLIGDARLYANRIDLPRGWTYTNDPLPGDIGVYRADDSNKYGHVVLVETVWPNGMFTYIEVCGTDGKFRHGGRLKTDPDIYIRPAFKTTS